MQFNIYVDLSTLSKYFFLNYKKDIINQLIESVEKIQQLEIK